MSVLQPALVNLPVSTTVSNAYSIPAYMGYIIATPTGAALYTLPAQASFSEGAWINIKNASAFTITVQDINLAGVGSIAAGGVGLFVSGPSGWLDFSVVIQDVIIPDDLQIGGYLSVGSIVPPTVTTNGSGTFTSGLNLVAVDGTAANSGIVFGLDTNLYRSAADILRTDDSLHVAVNARVGTYLNVGALTAPTNTAVGAINTVAAAPVSQAFGAVAANGTTGDLTFTTSLAAASSATAVVTNSSVIATSKVFVGIESYTGVLFTNGNPLAQVSARAAGNFTLTLINTHAANALTGTIVISFVIVN